MAKIYKYSTATIPMVFSPDGILANYSVVIVSFKQGLTQLDKETEDLDIDVSNNKITVELSQEETGMFESGKNAQVQVNIYYNDEKRQVSVISNIDVAENLYNKVIENE
jgi:hypothetical protein